MDVRIDSILLETTRLNELKDFYREGFGLEEPATEEPDQVGFQIGEVYLGLEQVDEASAPSRRLSLWFKVPDAQAAYERLLELGAKPGDAPQAIDDEVIASVFDLDGNKIGLLSDY